MPEHERTDADAELTRILDERLVTSVFQPIVDLESGATVGYEALARGPVESHLHEPEALFAAARADDRLADLDWLCRAAALRGALDAGLRPPLTLFVNIEPDVAGVPVPARYRELVDRARADLHVVVELTEHALANRPGHVLVSVPLLRAAGVAVALDDVGVDARSLALMAFLHPEVVKLDLRLVQESPDRELAATVHAVAARAEGTGTAILAEGIETPAHLERARALGARYGQGWLFGGPEEAPRGASVVGLATPLAMARRDTPVDTRATPFDLVSRRQEPRLAQGGLLAALALELEAHALSTGAAGVFLSAVRRAPGVEPADRYREMAKSLAFVAVLGDTFADGDPLADEWSVCVVSPHLAAAMVAQEVEPGADDGDGEGWYRYCLTYDRELVCDAARVLMTKVGRTESATAA